MMDALILIKICVNSQANNIALNIPAATMIMLIRHAKK